MEIIKRTGKKEAASRPHLTDPEHHPHANKHVCGDCEVSGDLSGDSEHIVSSS